MNSETKQCQNCKQKFTIEPDDFAFYEKVQVPAPTWCSECRMIRRVLWRNEKNMYRRKCDATGKEVLTFLPPDAPVKMYERDYWWSDNWDSIDYGRDYDFSKPFFGQLKELLLQVPWPSRSVINLVKSDYCMNCSDLKNCYLVFHATNDENCYYSVGLSESKETYDCLMCVKMEMSYGTFYAANCFKVFYSKDIENSRDLILCRNLVNCSDCVGCVNFRSKQYYIFNEPYSKENYFKKVRELKLDTYSGLNSAREKFVELQLRYPYKYMTSLRSIDVSGDYIYMSKNVKNSFMVDGSEDMKYCQSIILPPYARSCYDYSFFGKGAELVYEGQSIGFNSFNIKFSAFVYLGAQRVEYSIMSPSCEDIFGCIGLRKKKYCILNKQYSKEEYKAMIPKIKNHMNEMPYVDSRGCVYKYGEFFPHDFCPFGYNDAISQEYRPLSKQKALETGFKWTDPVDKPYKTTISWKDLPDSIQDVNDSIQNEIILCQAWEEDQIKALEHHCTKAFKILFQELQFYKSNGIPLPRKCFNSRHYDRTLLRNMPNFYDRRCQCAGVTSDNSKYTNVSANHQSHGVQEHCPNEFETSYAPDRKEIVYCEQCYQAEVV